MYCVVSNLPVHAHSGTCLCNPNDLTANWNSQRSFPYNIINRAPNLGNGQVYQGERSVLGVSTLWGSHNIPQVPAMALQLAGVTLVPALTPQMAGGNVHTGAPPWFEATEENQLNIQVTTISSRSLVANKSGRSHKLNQKRDLRDCLGRKEKDGDGRLSRAIVMITGSPILAEFGSMAAKRNLEKNLRMRNKNYPMWRVILRCQLGYSLISANK
ncbi:hypothetical protein NC652_035249 [Populus alba x Populus x berolinensis]|nr:hypothetical protein NC652_035249 [Populus alba x Populus x berolinensis]